MKVDFGADWVYVCSCRKYLSVQRRNLDICIIDAFDFPLESRLNCLSQSNWGVLWVSSSMLGRSILISKGSVSFIIDANFQMKSLSVL